MRLRQELTVAREAVRTASLLCQDIYARGSIGVTTKKDASPVTLADLASQALVCRTLALTFPADPVVGEENPQVFRSGQIDPQILLQDDMPFSNATVDDVVGWIAHGNGRVSDRFWTLDPLDGTKGFVSNGQFCVALALVVDGMVELGVLGCPRFDLKGRHGMLVSAVRGEGAIGETLDGGASFPLRVLDATSATKLRRVESVHHGSSTRQQQAFATIESEPPLRIDSQVKYAAVAGGEAAFYLRLPSDGTYREKIWDHAAGSIIVEEAGGRVTDQDGHQLDFGREERFQPNTGILASAGGHLHDRVLENIRVSPSAS